MIVTNAPPGQGRFFGRADDEIAAAKQDHL
jgi:hypothetical protein